MAPLHPHLDLRGYSSQIFEDNRHRNSTRSSRISKSSTTSSSTYRIPSTEGVAGLKRASLPMSFSRASSTDCINRKVASLHRRTDSFRRQERHFMQRSDAYITSRELAAPRVHFKKATMTYSVDTVRRNVDYRRSLVVERKVEGIYDYLKSPVIPEVDYAPSTKVSGFNGKRPFGLSTNSRLSVFKEKKTPREGPQSINALSNLTRTKSSMILDIASKQSSKTSNLKSALKLSKSDTRLNINKLEVKWDSDSETKSDPIADWVSDSTSASKSESRFIFNKISPKIIRKLANKSTAKSYSKLPLFRTKRSATHSSVRSANKDNSDITAGRGSSVRPANKDNNKPTRKTAKQHLIPRARIKGNISSGVLHQVNFCYCFVSPGLMLSFTSHLGEHCILTHPPTPTAHTHLHPLTPTHT